jgi:DNA polymerase-1
MVAVDRRLEREGLRAALILQVHDELLLEVPEAECDAVARSVREEMEGAFLLEVPLRVDVASGRSWAAAH